MLQKIKIEVDKKSLKNILSKGESIVSAIDRLVLNSLEAYLKTYKAGICEIDINFYDDLINVSDNSGGIDKNLSADKIFRIGQNAEKNKGLGLKKALARLGDKMTIESTNQTQIRKLIFDFNEKDNDLSVEEDVIYKENLHVQKTTQVCIDYLHEDVKEQIKDGSLKKLLNEYLSSNYRKFIEKNVLEIKIDNEIVTAYQIQGEKLIEQMVLDKIMVRIYKKSNNEKSGIDFFGNDFLFLDRTRKWSLTKRGYHFKDCIIEIIAEKSINEVKEEIEEIQRYVNEFINNNSSYFKSKTIQVKCEIPIEIIEDLKLEYEVEYATEVGRKAIMEKYEQLLWRRKKNKLKKQKLIK